MKRNFKRLIRVFIESTSRFVVLLVLQIYIIKGILSTLFCSIHIFWYPELKVHYKV